MRILYVLSGLPGSGKSTWGFLFNKSHPNTFIISSDNIRKEIGGEFQYFGNEAKVWDEYYSRANRYASDLKDCSVILDSTNLTNEIRKGIIKRVPSFDKYVLVIFEVPFEICIERNKMRSPDRIVPQNIMENMHNTYEKLDEDTKRLFQDVIYIDN